MSPAMILEGKSNIDLSIKRLEFGLHVMVHSGTAGNMSERSIPVIALKPSNNAGGHFFMSLYSGERIHGYNWDDLPIDEAVIEWVEQLASDENQPFNDDNIPFFEWLPGIKIEDEQINDDSDLSSQNEHQIKENEQNNIAGEINEDNRDNDQNNQNVNDHLENYVTDTDTVTSKNTGALKNTHKGILTGKDTNTNTNMDTEKIRSNFRKRYKIKSRY